MKFRMFLESEEQENLKKLLMSLPKGHRELLDGYKFKYTGGNTLKGDDKHIGYIYKDKVVVAAPWNYSRAFTTLHEIAHLVWEYIVTDELKKEWKQIVKETKQKQIDKFSHKDQKYALRQGAEEIFCMSYAAFYCTHTPAIWVNPKWSSFMKKIENLKSK